MSVSVTIQSGSLRITVESGSAETKQPNGGRSPNSDPKENEQQPNGEDTDTDKEFEHVDEVAVYDTRHGEKIHYRRHCRGLKTATTLHQLFVCTCWNHCDARWPKPDQEVALYTVGLRKFACCNNAMCVPEGAVMATPKLVCKICGKATATKGESN